MTLGTRIVIGMVAGLAVGGLFTFIDGPVTTRIVSVIEPVGTLWLNALRMTVVPLVISLLITGMASASQTASTGRLAARALLLFVVLLTAAAVAGALLTPAALAVWPVHPDSATALRAGAGMADATVPQLPPWREWITAVIPVNPFAAAADADMLPLVIFALLFGLAASRIQAAQRERLLGFFQAVADAVFVLVRWILIAAPAGVFALALGVGFRGGIEAAGALVHYLVLMCALCIVITLAMYPLATLAGGMPLRRFVRAAAPAQALAFSTQSSLACLPVMLESARSQLGLPARVSSVVLPLAVSLFRITSPIVNLSIVLFVAHVHGIDLDPAQLVAGVAVAVVTSFAVVGLPSQITFFTTTVPISLAMGVPTDILPLLLAIEVIPDLFRTVGNVTADLTASVILARRAELPDAAGEPARSEPG